jgi:hypothetical protein
MSSYKPGDYRGRIKDYRVSQSPVGRHHPTVFIAFDVIGRYDPATGELGPCEPGTRTYTKAITPRTIGWLLSDLKAIGYDKVGFTYLDPEAPGAVNLFGREIEVACVLETYEGRERERWSIRRGPPRTKLAQGNLEQLDAQFGEELKKAFGGGLTDAAPPTLRDPGDETP